MAPPPIKFKDLDLEAYMSQHKLLNGPYFPFDVRTDYVKVTDDTVLVPVTVQIKNRDITFQSKGRRFERRGQYPGPGFDHHRTHHAEL